MRKSIWILILIGFIMAGRQTGMVCADVVIKVRALNPLDTKEKAVINYPLPKKISKENILKRKITYSMDHSEDEEPPKTNFRISFNENEGGYYIDDEVFLLPKEVVTLEVHVEDVWAIKESQIMELRDEVEGVLQAWEEELFEGEATEEQNGKEETREFALMMKEEILGGLDQIIERQKANKIINVGVERHIAAYEDNMDELRQVQQDIVLLTNLVQFEIQEGDGEDLGGSEPSGSEAQESVEPQISDENETADGEENIEL